MQYGIICNKIPHSKHEAEKARGKGSSKGKKMRIYFCPKCKAYHLTKEVISRFADIQETIDFFKQVKEPKNTVMTFEEMMQNS